MKRPDLESFAPKSFVLVAFVAVLLAGCAAQPDNVAMPPADQRPKQAEVVTPPLQSGQK